MKGVAKTMAFGGGSRKEREHEDLALFREMFKREKERSNVVSLLEPVSSEFEPLQQGSFPLIYKLPSGKNGDFLGAGKEKNDYDWLKTPPATPLFPSLEMEANDPNMIFQRELPIMQHMRPSRFSTKKEEPKHEPPPKSPSSRSTTSTKSYSSSRSETPSPRPTSSYRSTLTAHKTPSNPKTESKLPAMNPKNKPSRATESSRNTSGKKPPSRGVSPMTRSRVPSTMPGFSNEAPPNLITSDAIIQKRSMSATRGRPVSKTFATVEPKIENGRNMRQSCSPSVTRGRKVEPEEQKTAIKPKVSGNTRNGTLVVGSKMVEKMMNARRSAGREEKDVQAKERNVQGNERSGINGRLMSRTSLDMAAKKWENSKSSAQSANTGTSTRLSSHTNSTTSDVRNFRARTAGSTACKFPVLKKSESRMRN